MKTFLIIGALYGLFDRLRELTTFESWLDNWRAYCRLEKDGFWWRWWGSQDKYELKKWYKYLWRDAYHTFKNLCVLLFIIALPLSANWHDLLVAYISFSIVQIILGYWIKYG